MRGVNVLTSFAALQFSSGFNIGVFWLIVPVWFSMILNTEAQSCSFRFPPSDTSTTTSGNIDYCVRKQIFLVLILSLVWFWQLESPWFQCYIVGIPLLKTKHPTQLWQRLVSISYLAKNEYRQFVFERFFLCKNTFGKKKIKKKSCATEKPVHFPSPVPGGNRNSKQESMAK